MRVGRVSNNAPKKDFTIVDPNNLACFRPWEWSWELSLENLASYYS